MSKVAYKITLYDDEMELKGNLNLKKFSSIWTFSAQENWGLSNLTLKVDKDIWENNLDYWDIITIKKSKKFIYSGYILDTSRIIDTTGDYLEIKLVWLSWLLSTCIFTETYNITASNIVKDLINDFNTEYGFNIFTYDSNSIPDSTGNLNMSFENKTYLEALNDVAETSGLKFYIWADRKVYFHDRWTTANHKIWLWKEVTQFKREKQGSEIVNSLILKYSWWEKTYPDLNSTYKKKEKRLDKSSEINDETTADIFWAEYINKYKDIIKKTSIIVGNEYTFFDIKPLDLIKVKNIWEEIWLLQVSKVTYSLENAKVELERYDSLWNTIFSN